MVQPAAPLACGRLTRRSLLLGTALASTLLLGTVATPTPAHAVTCPQPPGGPINVNSPVDSIDCVNVFDIFGAPSVAINLTTSNDDHFITLDNSGNLGAGEIGIYTLTTGASSFIDIVNTGDITVSSFAYHVGIFARTGAGANSPITINNSGTLDVTTAVNGAYGIIARTSGANSRIGITNTGDINATSTATDAYGIYARSSGDSSGITIDNTGDLTVKAKRYAVGMFAFTSGANSNLSITNSATITTSGVTAPGNTGNNSGIRGLTNGPGSDLTIVNSGDITTSGRRGFALFGDVAGANSTVTIRNTGRLETTGYTSHGIVGQSFNQNTHVIVDNSGDIITHGERADGIATGAFTIVGGSITVWNHADITTYGDGAIGIFSGTQVADTPISITNSGNIRVLAPGETAAISARAPVANSPIHIENSGSLFGNIGIFAQSLVGNTIVNSGDISASESQNNLAIFIDSGRTDIYNTGTITGWVRLSAENDRFFNQAGGIFETKATSFFRGGNDLFRNEAGGTVQAATSANVAETTAFEGLETFENQGLISLQDGGTGDSFTISNTPGGTDLNFKASGNSTLAVDAFLGGPGNSSADTFTVEGNVSGTTTVAINNTNTGPGVFNSSGIPVVFVTGNTPNANAFQLAQPIDTGFFDYDLFFNPTGSGFWDLKSYPGAGAHLLPQLVTAAQDIWHQGSSTWFDRTADLRVLLNGGAAPASAGYGAAVPTGNFTPATWVRGSGSWLDRDDSAKTSAYGRTYKYDLDRELDTMDFQMGLDLGKRDFLSQGDILVFGMLGGFVHGDLDYDKILRDFDFDGGQVGAYATYLKGGLFVDTLLNVHLLEMDANHTLGFPSEVDVTTVGLRTDTGYRFGSFSGGAFLEPLATLEVTWADIDGFNLGGNKVSFDDDANVRGRLGLRAGTTAQAWEGTMMEPFVTGSLWGNFTDDNQAKLVSSGSTFRFQDDLDDVWGEVSAGVNFFNPSATTAVFAKVDVTFGEDVEGVGGKAGMRVSW